MLKFKTLFSSGENRAVRRLSDLDRLRIYRESQTEQVGFFVFMFLSGYNNYNFLSRSGLNPELI